MKKIIAIMIALTMILSLCACGSSGNSSSGGSNTASEAYNIAIVQQLDHASLDEISAAAQAQLEALAAAEGIEIKVTKYSGQNDSTVINQIADEIIDDVDLIIPVATVAAQCMANKTDGTDIPVIYAAVSDPVGAGLTDIANVTGTSDALNTPFILDMMFAIDPDIQCVGLLYSNSEPNSAAPIAEAKEYLDAKGIEYIEKTGNTTDEIMSATNSLVDRVDAVFTPTDNTVMAAAGAVAEVLNAAGIPHYTGADSFVTAGAFTTCGVNYTELGTYTADMAFAVLTGGEIGEFHVMDGGIITVNTETAAALDIDYSVFSEMANTVKEVVTAAE